jgi:hypothetical protein
MRSSSCIGLFLLILFVAFAPCYGQLQTLDVIGLYSDDNYTDCSLTTDGRRSKVYVVYKLLRTSRNGASFRLETGGGFNGVLLKEEPAVLAMGSVTEGAVYAFGRCMDSDVLLTTLTYYFPLRPPSCSWLEVKPHPGARYGTVEAIDCNGVALIGEGSRMHVNGNETCPCRTIRYGIIFVSGRFISPPYSYSVAADDTARVNGIPIFPVRSGRTPPPPTVKGIHRKQHALGVRADSAGAGVTPYEEKVARMADVYRRSPLVERNSVILNDCGFTFRWVPSDDTPAVEDEVIVGREHSGSPERIDPEQRIEFVRRVVDAGGMVALGKGYRISTPRDRVNRTVELITRLRRGESLSDEDIRGTALMFQRFRDSLLEATGEGKK